ncbi:hypothetical protein DIPPA_31476 [Diplonema papillatum]|nr:hypothetical protein DIPPA_31476 [Diplonema papillatum]
MTPGRPIPAWLREKVPELGESDVLMDEIACSHQRPTGEREKGRLYFTTNYLVYSGTTSPLVMNYQKTHARGERKSVVLKVELDTGDTVKHVLIPEEPRQCNAIIRAITRAAKTCDLSSDHACNDNPPTARSDSFRRDTARMGEPTEAETTDDEALLSTRAAFNSLKYTRADASQFSPPAEVKASKIGAFHLAVTLSQAVDNLLSDKSMFMADYHKKLGDTKFEATKWATENAKTGGTRLVTCRTSTPFGDTAFVESQRFAVYREGEHAVAALHASAVCPEAQYGASFRVETLLELVPEGSKRVKATFYGILKWTAKPPTLKGMIQSNVEKGLRTSFAALRETAMVATRSKRRVEKKDSLISPSHGASHGSLHGHHSSVDAQATTTNGTAPADSSNSPTTPSASNALPFAILPMALFLVVMCAAPFFASRSLRWAEEHLQQAIVRSPERTFQAALEELQQRRVPLLQLKAMLRTQDGKGLAALPATERQDLVSRLTELRMAIEPVREAAMSPEQQGAPPAAGAASTVPPADTQQPYQQQQQQQQLPQQLPQQQTHQQQQQQQQQPPPYEQQPPPYGRQPYPLGGGGGPAEQQPPAKPNCDAEVGPMRVRHSQGLKEIHNILVTHVDRINEEQVDMLFRLRLLLTVALVSFACSVRQLISTLLG